MNTTQKYRLWVRSGFFLLFILAPPLDLFRYDLELGHFIFLGQPWQLSIVAFQQDKITAAQAAINMALFGFLPIALVIGVGGWVSWRWGRLYCGWLCPHFSVVEIINAVMRRATGKPSVWEKYPLPEVQQDGKIIVPDRHYAWLVGILAVFFAFLWAVVLLTYLVSPTEIYTRLFSAQITRNQAIFIAVATGLLLIEFTFARHLFCRFGCAIGLAQSLIWMGNKRALVIGFNRSRSRACGSCDASCEHACPMRLKPRNIKRKIFTCTQCLQCIQACENVQARQQAQSLLKTLKNDCAYNESVRDFGNRPEIPGKCFSAREKATRARHDSSKGRKPGHKTRKK